MSDIDVSLASVQKNRLHREVISKVPIRISVTGTRGKSSQVHLIVKLIAKRDLWTIAKITGDIPFFFDNDAIYKIIRKDGRPVLMDETAFLTDICNNNLGRYPDAVVLENQAIKPYTMLAFHRLYCKPRYIVVTNIRRDHCDFLGNTKDEVAHAIGEGFADADTVISGETDKGANDILKFHAQKIGAAFMVATVPPEKRNIPGVESIYTAKMLLECLNKDFSNFGNLKMTDDEVETLINVLENTFTLQSGPSGVEWFDGAKLNDIDSSKIVFDYLQWKYPERRFTLLAYFRKDRASRTISFLKFFNEMLDFSKIDRIYMAGHGSEYVYNRINQSIRSRFIQVADNDAMCMEIMKDLAKSDSALITIVNAVSPFMRRIREIQSSENQRHVIYASSIEAPNALTAKET